MRETQTERLREEQGFEVQFFFSPSIAFKQYNFQGIK